MAGRVLMGETQNVKEARKMEIELHKITMNQACEYIAGEVADEHGVSMAKARKLVANAILYSVVLDEIYAQINFLLGEDELYTN